ncbi:head-tail connector protein [Microbispora rosea]|uniref:head-tail connector protein n=1 Tax=Microbispora rosea TaxID=58117 RepID=UPI003787502A
MAIGDPYATLDELKDYLSLADTVDDTKLSMSLSTVSRGIEHYCRRQFNRAETATPRVFPPLDRCTVRVNDFYTDDDLSVSVDVAGDETFSSTLTVDQYWLRPHNGVVDGEEGWPYNSLASASGAYFLGLVQVTARWGWEAVPEPVHQACLILASELAKLKDAPFGVAGFGEWGPVRVRQNPMACELLHPYRRLPVLVG